MKTLTKDELKRIDATYEMLDHVYGSLRQFTTLQRKAFSSGNVPGQSLCDSHIHLLTLSTHACWRDIHGILAEPVAKAEQEAFGGAPAKEVIQ